MQRLWPLLVLAALTGCELTTSEGVNTSNVWADMRLVNKGAGTTRAYATLRVGGELSNTYLDLAPGDSMSVRVAGGQSQVLSESVSDLINAASYGTDVSVNPGDAVTFTLTRAEGESAPNSSAVLPPALSVSSPAAGASVSRANDDIRVQWGPTGTDRIEVRAFGSCIEGFFTELSSDTGEFTIQRGTLVRENEDGSTCEITVEVKRQRGGTLDAAFRGGTIYGIQEREVKVTSTP